MPFIKLVDHHKCPTPDRRDDGSQLQIGDQWACNEKLADGSGRTCLRVYKWHNDQREGYYWMPISSPTPV